jgi:Bacteriophage tail sheath protein
MPVTPTYPGVYIEELPSGVHTITAVSTSVTAFAGFTPRGPIETPVTLTSFADFERGFSGLSADSVLSYAVQHFFLNGGSLAIVVRLASGAKYATGTIKAAGSTALTVTANNPDTWSDTLRVAIDHNTPAEGAFNLQVFDLTGAVRESFTNLSMTSTDPNFVTSIVNPGSALINVAAQGTTAPDPSGTVSKAFADPLPDLAKQITVTIGSTTSDPFTVYDSQKDGNAPTTMGQLAVLLERKIRQQGPAFGAVRVTPVGRTLQVVAGPDDTVHFGLAGASDLGLEGTVNPGAYPLSGGASGNPPGGADFIGSADAKTGLNALRDVTDVNLLCLPDIADPSYNASRVEILAAADELCQDKRMFLLVDSPAAWTTLDRTRAHLPDLDSVRSDHSALYFPQIEMTDPLSGQLRSFPPCGAVAGIMARTDSDRGVWKAPAGTAASLSGVQALTVPLTDLENGLLNPLGVNCLRAFPIVGPVVWGARTLQGADVLTSQWKYVPVRRTALMIEESLYRGTKWVVFEPNDERLWGQIRLNVGAFMQSLFKQGAFQGTSARDAYFVKCDATTTTQDDINRGVVNIIVGFAPLKPAEFVIIQIEQMAGQL